MKNALTFFILLFLPFLALAQYSDVGIYSGIAVLKGETVHETLSIKGAGYTGGLVYKRHVGQKLGLKGSVGFGNYRGDDNFYPGQSGRRNFKFKTNFIEASAVVEFAFFKEKRYERGIFYGSFSPFINAGIGFLYINPTAEATGPIMIEEEDFDFEQNIFSVPVGGGLRLDISENITISGYINFYVLAGDYLDGLSFSGNPSIDDYLFTGGFTATYHPSKDAGQRYNLSSL